MTDGERVNMREAVVRKRRVKGRVEGKGERRWKGKERMEEI